MKVLFVCSANVNRSKAFEREFKKFYKDHPDKVEIRSSGIYSYSGYGYKLDRTILEWADVVYVMTVAHQMFIEKSYNEFINKVRVIGISDEYDVDDEALIEVINYWHDRVFMKERFKYFKSNI